MTWRDKVRAAEQVQIWKASPTSEPTETTKRVSVVFVGANSGEAAPIQTPTVIPQRPYQLTREQADEAHAQPWDDVVIEHFVARVTRLIRLGLNVTDADDLAERLHLRDVQHDDRSMCLECRHYRPGRCSNHRRAGLNVRDVGRDFAAMLQRCPGFDSTEAKR